MIRCLSFCCLAGAMVIGCLLLTGTMRAQSDLTAEEIMERVDRVVRGDSSRAVVRMEVVTENWERQLTMEMWSLGTDYALVRVQSPAREAGTATLMADDDIWNYLPKVDRSIKIPSSMMAGSWLGSHFTNDDLVKESQLVDDYDIELVFSGEQSGVQVWDFELTPKPEAAVVWGKVDYRVRQDDYMPMRARYFDEDGELVRTMTFSDYQRFDNRIIPAVFTMEPADKPNELTLLRYEDIEFDIDVDESFFSLQQLKSR